MVNVLFSATLPPPKAHKINLAEGVTDALLKPLQGPATTWSALVYGNAKDNQLGRMDDTMKKTGTIAIASLGSLGVNYPGGSLPLWLGAASWLTAMVIPSFVINALVWLKTGINLNTQYKNSNGEVQSMYMDPNYLPIQLIPKETRIQIAKNWGISQSDPDRPLKFHQKLQQIATQTRTWWMLMAGPATPLLSAVICDRLEEPVKNWFSRLQISEADKALNKLGLHPAHPQRWEKALRHRIFTSIGIGTGTQISALSRWWNQLPEDLIKTLKLDTLKEKEIIASSPSQLASKISEHLSSRLRQSKAKESLEYRVGLEDLVKRQEAKLTEIFKPLHKLFQNKHLPPVAKAELEHQMRFEYSAAHATLKHFQALLALPLGTMKPEVAQKTLLHQMQHAKLSSVIDQLEYESLEKAVQLSGGPEQAMSILKAFLTRRFEEAFKAMGASPMECLTQAVRSYGLRQRWLRLYPGLMGKVMLTSTVLFVTFIVGRDFEKPKEAGHAH